MGRQSFQFLLLTNLYNLRTAFPAPIADSAFNLACRTAREKRTFPSHTYFPALLWQILHQKLFFFCPAFKKPINLALLHNPKGL